MTGSRTVVVARQAGTAAAFVPIVTATSPVLFAYPPAVSVFARTGLGHTAIATFEGARQRLADLRPDRLITGTSLDVEDDSRWWAWARAHGVPSVAFVDQWVNYAERFTVDTRMLPPAALPDRIAVVDALASDRLADTGLPRERIVVTGTPLLDTWQSSDTVSRAAARGSLGWRDDALIILYACEPDPRHWTEPGHLADAGFDARLTSLLGAAVALATATRAVHVAVKPHPIQTGGGHVPRLPAPPTGVSVSVTDRDPRELALAADIVIGHRSMLLHEASAAGCRVVSLLEDGEAVPDLVLATPGLRVCRRQDLADTLREVAAGTADAAGPRGQVGATARFLAALGIEEEAA